MINKIVCEARRVDSDPFLYEGLTDCFQEISIAGSCRLLRVASICFQVA